MKASEVRAKCPKWVHGGKEPGSRFCQYLSPDEVWCRNDDNHCHVMPSIIRERLAKAEVAKQTSLPEPMYTVLKTPFDESSPPGSPDVARVGPSAPAAVIVAPAPAAAIVGPAGATSGGAAIPLTSPAGNGRIPTVEPTADRPKPLIEGQPDSAITEGVKRLIDETERIQAYLKETTWNFSRINAGLSCMRRYWLKYIVHAEAGGDKYLLGLGSFFKESIDAIDCNAPVEPFAEITSTDALKLAIALQKYTDWPERANVAFHDVELKSSMDFAGYKIPLMGFIGGVGADKKTLYEFEYASEVATYPKLLMARQAAISFHLYPEADTWKMAIFHKAKQRIKKDETAADFTARLKNEVKPEDWLDVITVRRDQIDVKAEMAEIGMAALHIAMGVIAGYSTGVTHSNRDAVNCGLCEYNKLCSQWVTCFGDPEKCGAAKNGCQVIDACAENKMHRDYMNS